MSVIIYLTLKSNKMIEKNKKTLFVLRRAFWIGRTTSHDVATAFDVSEATARRILAQAVDACPQWLERIGRSGVFPRPGIPIPREASADTMLALLEQNVSFETCGLRPEELNVIRSSYPSPSRPVRGLEVILEALIVIHGGEKRRPRALEILYVGMKRGDQARWRTVFCNALEHDGRKWYLLAQDLDEREKAYPQKVYALSRILDARRSSRRLPRNFKPSSVIGRKVGLRLFLDEHLTADQRKALENELGIQGGKIFLPEYEVFAFRRNYCGDTEGMHRIIWPPVADWREEK